MQNTSQSLINILNDSTRDFLPGDLIEFYEPSVVDLVPGNAVKRFANTSLTWYGWKYEQQAISRGSTARFIDERFNTVSLTFSNVDREVGRWLSSTSISGYRVVVRAVSRSLDSDSIVLFVGRCEKAFSVTNSSVSLTIKQDLGSINSELPPRKFVHACPLKFKGKDCLGGNPESKTQTYQNAATCNKSWQQCTEYGNTASFQGFRYNNVSGSFVLRERSSLGLPTKSTKQWSSQENTPINEHVPMGLGRTQIELTSVASADTGQFLYGHWVAGEGPITRFLNVRNVTPGFAQRFQGQRQDGTSTNTGSYREHLGQYGQDPSQPTVSNFLGTATYSGRAYIEGTIRGQNPDTGDPAPTIVGNIMWTPIPTATRGTTYNESVKEWTDNPVDHVRYLLTSDRALQLNPAFIDDQAAIDTAQYCEEPLLDESGGEDLVVVQNDDVLNNTFNLGRFRSTGLIDPFFWRRRILNSGAYGAEQFARINYVPSTTIIDLGDGVFQEELVPPPSNLVPTEYFRKRYTANWHLKKGVKVADFLFKQLLPSFRGYLVTGANGKIQIRSERSAVQSRSSGAVSPSMNTIDVYDGNVYKNLNLPVLNVLIRNPETAITRASVRQIVGIQYQPLGNAITIGPPSSGAPDMNCRIWGAIPDTQSATTFSGGSVFTQAFAYIVVNDGLTANSTAGVRIDGVDVGAGGPFSVPDNFVQPPPNPNWSAEIAAMIATNLNGNPKLKNINGIALRDYIEAVWDPNNPRMVLFRSKQATLILDRPFEIEHPVGDLVTHFHLGFSDGSDGNRSNILKDSFEWPLGGRQTAYNQFLITYQDSVQDAQSVAVVENDYDHQEATNQINKIEVPGGECVDNYHQADRLLLAARYKYRESDFFVKLETTGLAMLLEEGDLILVNHSSMPLFRNYLYRIEELSVSAEHRVSIIARLYSDVQYPDQPVPKTVSITRSNDWQTTRLPQIDPATVTIERLSNSGNAARVKFPFPSTLTGASVRVFIQRVDPVTQQFIDAQPFDTGVIVFPDENNAGSFEIPGVTTGTVISLRPVTTTGIQGPQTDVGAPELPDDAGGGTGVTDGDKGDITVSNTGATWTINADAVTTAKILDANVTLAKMANMATDSLIGRDTAGTGSPEVITLSQALDFVGSAAQGDILYRGASTWTRLGAGIAGQLLQTAGTGANPAWATVMPFKNVLINGDFQVAQIRTSESGISAKPNGAYHTADQWKFFVNTLGTWTEEVINEGPTTTLHRKALRVTCTTAQTSPAAGGFVLMNQPLEGQFVQAFLKGRTNALPFALSFWARSSITGTFIAELVDRDNNRSVSLSYAINAANTWERKTLVFPADTTGTFDNDANLSLDLIFWLAAGTNFTDGASLQTTWGTLTSNRRATGIATANDGLAGATSRTWDITGVQLEASPICTEFEFLPFDMQLQRCERYLPVFATSGSERLFGGTLGFGPSATTRYVALFIPFRIQTRVAPTGYIALTLANWTVYDFSKASANAITPSGQLFNAATTRIGSILLDVPSADIGTPGSVVFSYPTTTGNWLVFTGAQL